MKPNVYFADSSFSADGLFSEQDKPVSISIDTMELVNKNTYRVFIESEPPEVRNIVESIIDFHENYDLILAWHEKILSECPNSVKFVSPSAPWCGKFDPNTVSYRQGMQNKFEVWPFDTIEKKFSVSFLTSSKGWCPGHVLRHEVFGKLPILVGSIFTSKHYSPPRLSGEARTLLFDGFQYHIAIENAKHNNFFTEKVLDCFTTRAIPLYWGCPNIGEYFNMDGILVFDTYRDLIQQLESLNSDHYQMRSAAVEDNFNRALEYKDYFSRVDSVIRKHL